MIDGYITYNELKIITGYSDKLLTRLLIQGMNTHELEVVKGIRVENPIPIRDIFLNTGEYRFTPASLFVICGNDISGIVFYFLFISK